MTIEKKPLKLALVFTYFLAIFGVVCLFLNPQWLDIVISEPLYGYSILIFFLSFVLVLIILYKGSFSAPSLFMLIFFVMVPWLGAENFKNYLENHSDFWGRQLPSFSFPTFVWSIGTLSFFAGVLLAYFFVPGLSRKCVQFWDRKRMLILLTVTLTLTTVATVIAIYKIGHIPLLTIDISGERADYVEIVGPVIYRFSNLWLVTGLMASILFFLEKGKSRYLYLLIVMASGLGKMAYGQRTGLVLIIIIFGLMYLKSNRLKISHVLLLGVTASIMVYALMLQGEYKEGRTTSDRPLKKTIVTNTFHEWRYYSTILDETRDEEYLGWQIFLGPFITLLPRQVYSIVGYDKAELIGEYSAVFYYGRMFDEPYGIRITPIGEAFAGFGISGVIFQLLVLGLFFGALEKIYLGLRKQDARLFLTCYLFSEMLYLPIATVYNLLAPLIQTGIVVLIFYFWGSKKHRLEGSKVFDIKDRMFAP